MDPKVKQYVEAQYHDYLSITEATKAMPGINHAQYVRRLIKESVAAVEEGKEPKFPWPTDGRPIAAKLRLPGRDQWFLNPESVAGYAPRKSFGASGMRRFLLRFNTDKWDDDAMIALITKALGTTQGEATFIFEPAYKPGSGSGRGKGGKGKSKTPEDFTASIVASLQRGLTQPQAVPKGTTDTGRKDNAATRTVEVKAPGRPTRTPTKATEGLDG